ncbi:MAG TPA: hypothetical protein DIC50_06040 [Verrucomicrobia subdivision 3 bacterium]|nr:hypothetical protein [Limisphaerales bacterium]
MLASLARGKPARLIERTLPLAEFFVAYRQTALRPGEMLKTIRVPRGAGQLISAGRDSRPGPQCRVTRRQKPCRLAAVNRRQYAVQQGVWIGGAAGDIDIHGDDLIHAAQAGIVRSENASAAPAGAHGHHQARSRHRFIRFAQR